MVVGIIYCVLNRIWLFGPMDSSLQALSVYGYHQQVLEWVAIPSLEIFPDSGIEPEFPVSLYWQAVFTTVPPRKSIPLYNTAFDTESSWPWQNKDYYFSLMWLSLEWITFCLFFVCAVILDCSLHPTFVWLWMLCAVYFTIWAYYIAKTLDYVIFTLKMNNFPLMAVSSVKHKHTSLVSFSIDWTISLVIFKPLVKLFSFLLVFRCGYLVSGSSWNVCMLSTCY